MCIVDPLRTAMQQWRRQKSPALPVHRIANYRLVVCVALFCLTAGFERVATDFRSCPGNLRPNSPCLRTCLSPSAGRCRRRRGPGPGSVGWFLKRSKDEMKAVYFIVRIDPKSRVLNYLYTCSNKSHHHHHAKMKSFPSSSWTRWSEERYRDTYERSWKISLVKGDIVIEYERGRSRGSRRWE